ncbi:uncharacterized protein LOC110459787 isoform X1 [Mizuhopecten yessoensis]|uniref:Uncharacterized protein n=1 Tax=Mizuhopecten yessoensis TaxID=6573 RepID=A0A210Q3X9_MIZYE|nr:uncharacterized protein LOC110459787 isoform X1 [Mizuhopecten yessoensis]OWF43412.1 hypothetical protein KP79_PYT21805 [Mizuhopecten yessoensis]
MSALLVVCISLCVAVPAVHGSINSVMSRLSDRIFLDQNTRDSPGHPPFSWSHNKGLYGTEVKLNFHGEPEMAVLREAFSIYDNNMFATAWITACSLETTLYGTGPMTIPLMIDSAVEAIGNFHNRNYNFTNSIMTFWPQVYNATTRTFQSTPSNLLQLLQLADTFPVKLIEDLMKIFGLKDMEQVVEHLIQEKDMFSRAFHIPPDFDDTFVNLGLGALLRNAQESYPQSWKQWQIQNSNVTSALHALRKYAYRPSSTNPDVNTIDPRTYFYMRSFLSEHHDENLALVPTWIQNTREAMQGDKKGVSMPFSVNNVDVTVAANAIYGLTSGLLSNIIDDVEFDADLQRIYLNTSSLIAHELSYNFSSRPDLALTYYPSKHECYWFVARTLSLMQRYLLNNNETDTLPFPVMNTVKLAFENTLKREVTPEILKASKDDFEGRIYWDNFLGDGDINSDNSSVVRAEDRIFTTAMVVNTLIDVWTVYNQSAFRLEWLPGVSPQLNDTIKRAVAWLTDFSLGPTYKPWNTFFSGSGKGLKSLPFWYPANRIEYMNGTAVNSSVIPHGVNFLIGISGYVPDEKYNAMLKVPHFGVMTPTDFPGFNDPTEPHGFFPFWSSDSYTYSATLMALSKYTNIKQ